MKKGALLAILAFILATVGTKAEVRYISSRNGLSNSSVTCIYKDSEGYMWFGTWDGLNRYDGTGFEIFRPSMDESSLSGSVVRQILEDSDGNLWIATDRGIDRFDRRSRTFRKFLVNTTRGGIMSEHSFFLANDASGRLLAAVSNYGIYEYDRNAGTFRKLCRSDEVTDFIADKNSPDIWILSGSKLFRLTESVDETRYRANVNWGDNVEFVKLGSDGRHLWIRYRNDRWMHEIDIATETESSRVAIPDRTGKVNTMSEHAGNMLLGTESGLLEYSGESPEMRFDRIPVLSVLEDNDGILWVGTDMRGVAMVSDIDTPFHSITGQDASIFSNCAVRTFFEERPDRLWVGTKGNGLALTEPESGKVLLRFSEADGLENDNVYALSEGDEVIWIGTDGDGLDYIDKQTHKIWKLSFPEEFPIKSEYAILQTARNTLWVGTSGHGLYRLVIDRARHPYKVLSVKRFLKGSGLESNIVYALAQHNGEIWAGTRGGGPGRFSMDGTPLETGIDDSSVRDALNDMTCLYAGKSGNLWMGTSLGIYRRGKEGTIERVEARYINGTSVHGIIEDEKGLLWVSTNNGLVRIDTSENPVSETQFSIEDGLQDNEFSDGAFLASPYSKRIYFGGIAGFTYFDPERTGRSGTFPKLDLEGVYIGNSLSLDSVRDNGTDKEIAIEPGQKSFTLKFAALDFISADRCEMAYRLCGYSDDWIYLGTTKNIAFSNLPKGNYRLDIRYTNADKVWNDELYSVKLRILPEWYETRLAIISFWLLSILAAAGAVFSTMSRIRERRKIREDEKEKERIMDIHEAKLRFFTNIAHEFSNSLTLIYGPCKELQKMSSMPGESRKYLEYIENNSSRMLGLIQQLISFRKAETGHLTISPEEVDVCSLIRKSEEYFRGKLEEQGMKITTFLGDEHIRWITDRDCLEKILFNLLSNATKYTPSGGEIHIDCTEDSGKLRIAVTNYGVGIPEEKRDAIFDRFEVLDRFESNIRKGKISNGIGLSMCKTLVELMEGRIWIDSDGSSFTAFCFELPMLQTSGKAAPASSDEPTSQQPSAEDSVMEEAEDDSSEEPQEGQSAETDASGAERKKILIVDDDPGIRHFIKSLLGEKYSVAEASNGEEGMREMDNGHPDLVISDIMMPVMNGFELLRKIRENDVFNHIPVILLTSEKSDDNMKYGLAKGADAFVGKPFDPGILQATVTNLLGRDEAVLKYSSSAYSALDVFHGRKMAKEDKKLLTDFTNVILQNIDNGDLRIDGIVEQLNISKMQLYRKVKSGLGMTPVEYIKELRLEKAERLLKSTSRTVQQIMFDCGFNSKTYFYREFAKKYGSTPKQFRDSNKKH